MLKTALSSRLCALRAGQPGFRLSGIGILQNSNTSIFFLPASFLLKMFLELEVQITQMKIRVKKELKASLLSCVLSVGLLNSGMYGVWRMPSQCMGIRSRLCMWVTCALKAHRTLMTWFVYLTVLWVNTVKTDQLPVCSCAYKPLQACADASGRRAGSNGRKSSTV